jgi:hypothetical protein
VGSSAHALPYRNGKATQSLCILLRLDLFSPAFQQPITTTAHEEEWVQRKKRMETAIDSAQRTAAAMNDRAVEMTRRIEVIASIAIEALRPGNVHGAEAPLRSILVVATNGGRSVVASPPAVVLDVAPSPSPPTAAAIVAENTQPPTALTEALKAIVRRALFPPTF